jgi:hypothetical protein
MICTVWRSPASQARLGLGIGALLGGAAVLALQFF